MINSDTLKALNTRSSIRKYRDDPIPDEMLDAIIAASRRTPTTNNLQVYSLVVIRDTGTKEKLAELAGGQPWVAKCPVFIAICADLSRLEEACRIHGLNFDGNNLEMYLRATVDASLVGMSLSLAAESLGLGSVMIGCMRNHPVEVAKLLELPDKAYVVFGLCLGWPVNRPDCLMPRQPEDIVVYQEKYGGTDVAANLNEYDKQLGAFYDSVGKSGRTAWTRSTAQGCSKPQRPHLKNELQKLGFKFE